MGNKVCLISESQVKQQELAAAWTLPGPVHLFSGSQVTQRGRGAERKGQEDSQKGVGAGRYGGGHWVWSNALSTFLGAATP